MFSSLLSTFLHVLGFSTTLASSSENQAPFEDFLNASGSSLLPFKHEFTAYIETDLSQFRSIAITEGIRIGVQITGGNWTSADGSLLANVVPGVGAENGYIDTKGVFHPDARYSVQFVEDEKFGYVQFGGYGVAGVWNTVVTTLSTDSRVGAQLAQQTLIAPGKFVGAVLIAPHYVQQAI